MKTFNLIICLTISLVLLSCKNENKIVEPEIVTLKTISENNENTADIIETEFKDPNTAIVFEAYIKLKNALVNTNNVEAVLSAKALLIALEKVEVAEETTKVVMEIAESKEISAQREAFVLVTASVEKILEGALKSGTVYKQFCPMAFNNTGAYWLSTTREIQNPYFGDKMLKCGRIASEIK